ncbi:MAG: hypothetical protein QNJ31_03230 [Candidatus Caenarcaniphilales bacterium]|nr:hypothetical protein [Candidatus Caenarcaniphilales bacterium]
MPSTINRIPIFSNISLPNSSQQQILNSAMAITHGLNFKDKTDQHSNNRLEEESLKDLFKSMNLGPGISLSFQEFMYVFIPKTVSAILINHSWLKAIYEFLLDLPETVGMYILSAPIGGTFGFWASKQLKLPSFKLLGEPMWKLRKNLHGVHQIGEEKYKINQEVLSKVAFGKLASFIVAAGSIVVAQIMATLPRVFMAKDIFHTNNFYAISGLYVKPEDMEDSQNAKKATNKAKHNFWGSLLYFIASIPIMMGLTSMLGKHISRTKPKWIEKLSTHVDLGPRFSLSKMLAITGLAAAPYAYMSVSLNPAEKLENRDRLLFLAIPEVLFLKQVAGNILSLITGYLMGAGNVWMPMSKWKEEVKEGKREFLNLGLIDNDYISKLPKVQAMKPKQRERLMRNIGFMNHWVVYAVACGLGFLVNWCNFQRTEKMDEADERKESSSHNIQNTN